jgi:hypothetical protein
MAAKRTFTQTPLTKARKDKFLEVLADTGSFAMAARAASPHSTKDGCKNTFVDARRRDPEFDKACQDAITASLGKVEAEVMRRAMTPTKRPIFSKGELVGEEDVYDNKLLLALARKMSPEWRESRHLSVEGSVDHNHRHAHLSLSLDDIQLLAPEKADLLLELLSELADLRPASRDEPLLIAAGGDDDDDE